MEKEDTSLEAREKSMQQVSTMGLLTTRRGRGQMQRRGYWRPRWQLVREGYLPKFAKCTVANHLIDKAFLSNKEGNTSVSWRIDDLPKEEIHISCPTFVEPKVGRVSVAIICIRNEETVSKITHVTPLPKKERASS